MQRGSSNGVSRHNGVRAVNYALALAKFKYSTSLGGLGHVGRCRGCSAPSPFPRHQSMAWRTARRLQTIYELHDARSNFRCAWKCIAHNGRNRKESHGGGEACLDDRRQVSKRAGIQKILSLAFLSMAPKRIITSWPTPYFSGACRIYSPIRTTHIFSANTGFPLHFVAVPATEFRAFTNRPFPHLPLHGNAARVVTKDLASRLFRWPARRAPEDPNPSGMRCRGFERLYLRTTSC